MADPLQRPAFIFDLDGTLVDSVDQHVLRDENNYTLEIERSLYCA